MTDVRIPDNLYSVDLDLAVALTLFREAADVIRKVYCDPHTEKLLDATTQNAVQSFFEGYNAAAASLAELVKTDVMAKLV